MLSQYVVYILGGGLALSLLFGGVQTWRLSSTQGDLRESQEAVTVQKYEVTRLHNDLARYMAVGAQQAERVAEAQANAAKVAAQAQRRVAELAAQPIPAELNEAIVFGNDLGRKLGAQWEVEE